MPAGRLLVVAPDDDLRDSLVFALEAEGFDVVDWAAIPHIGWMKANRFDCTVLDQRAVRDEAIEVIAFCARAFPVVLLASRPVTWLADWVSDTIETPVIDNALLVAVRLAVYLPV